MCEPLRPAVFVGTRIFQRNRSHDSSEMDPLLATSIREFARAESDVAVLRRCLERSCGTGQSRPESVLVLEGEVRTANGSRQFRLPRCELEPGGELRGDFHPFRELEPNRPLVGVIDGIHHVYRQTALVEDKGDSDVVDLEARRLERTRRMTMSRSSFRIRCTQSMVDLALLAGSTVKTWSNLFLK